LSDRSAASFGRRLAAGTLDWVICWVLFTVIGLLTSAIVGADDDATSGLVAFIALASAPVVAYFAYFWAQTGATPGMRAVGIHLESEAGSQPTPRQALLRALAALVSAASVFVILNTAFSDRPEGGYSTATLAVFVVALALAAVSLLGHLWLLVDGRRTWQDKLFRLVVVTGPA
jgi:uncharacterized RDD family membrane protein YckC